MDELIKFVKERLRYANNSPKDAEVFKLQAFGAVDFFTRLYPKDWFTIGKFWDKYSQDFDKIIFEDFDRRDYE